MIASFHVFIVDSRIKVIAAPDRSLPIHPPKSILGNLSMKNKRIIPWARDFIVEGQWAQSLAESTRRNLRWFFVDGVFASASDSIPITYFTLLSGCPRRIRPAGGCLQLFDQPRGCAIPFPRCHAGRTIWPPPWLDGYFWGDYRPFVFARALPFSRSGFRGPELIWAVIVFAVARSITGNLAFPAWMSLTADLVPIEGRGRYFGVRGFAATVATITVVFFLENGSRSWVSPRLPVGAAPVLFSGDGSTFSFAKIRDPRPEHRTSTALTPRSIYEDLRASPLFVALCSAAALWSFSLNISCTVLLGLYGERTRLHRSDGWDSHDCGECIQIVDPT